MGNESNELISLIRDIINEKCEKLDGTVWAVVTSVNADATINAYILPDTENITENIQNPNNVYCEVDDVVLIYKVRSNISNSFVMANKTRRGNYAQIGISSPLFYNVSGAGETGPAGPQGPQGPQGPAGGIAPVVQETGQSTTDVMSQKAVTDELNGKASTSYVQGYVQGNPTASGTEDLTRLKVGDIVYNVPQGGGGSGVKVVQTTGQSETAVMSQKAVTKEIEDLRARIDYVAPTISTFTITPSKSSYKLPATFTLTSITHMETNVSNIVGDLTLKRGSMKLNITPSPTSATVTVSDTVTLTTSGVTYTLSGTDKKGDTFSKTVSVSAYYTSYFGASENSTVSNNLIAGLTDTNSASLGGTRIVNITGTSKYVWFISTRAISSIKSSGFEVPFTLVDDSYSYNETSYKCYRTTERVVAGNNTFMIV